MQWTHVKTPPSAGGMYLVGGYVWDGTLRYFSRTFASYRATTEGPEWSHKIDDHARVPIEYWCEMPAHPEHRVTVPDINAAFDPADEALGGAFKAGFREGWLFAKSPDFEDREEAEEDYPHVVDIAPSECWDAYREIYFAKLPLAAVPRLTVQQTGPAPSASGGQNDG